MLFAAALPKVEPLLLPGCTGRWLPLFLNDSEEGE